MARLRKTDAKSLADATEERLVQMILERDLQPGDQLPNETELCALLGVSRTTLREATHRLASRNILVTQQGAGTFVSEKRGIPEDPLGLTFFKRDNALALELSEVRLMLEPEIAQKAALNATAEQLERMRQLCSEVEQLITCGAEYLEADARLHCHIASCCGNAVLKNLIPIITEAIGVSIATTNDEFRSKTYQQHRRIVEAICRRDPLGAKYAMIMHLNTNRESFVRQLEQERGTDGNPAASF